MKHFLSSMQSILAAAFGVQSEYKREQDFKNSSPVKLILLGIASLILFILCVIFVVSLVIPAH